MSWIDGAWHRMRVFVRGERYAREQREELRVHLELDAQQHEANSAVAARRRLGNPSDVGVAMRRAAGVAWVDRARLVAEQVAQDVVHALRGLRRAPGFTATVVITLALGVGANAAMFSFLDRVFFRRPPGAEHAPDVRRIYVFERDPFGGIASTRAIQRFTYPEFAQMRETIGVGAEVAADIPVSWTKRAGELQTGYVSGNYFDLLGVRPALGRFFSADETRIDVDSRLAVITHAVWKREYGLDPRVIGKTIEVRSIQYTIIGVTGEGFAGIDVETAQAFLPLHAFGGYVRGTTPWYADRDNWSPLRPLLRTRPGQNESRLLAAATIPYRESLLNPRRKADTTTRLAAGPLIEALGPATNSKDVSLSARIAGVTLIVLLIACANVASLLLVRATQRRREIAVRLALGVSRKRLWSQVVIESLTLAAIGAACSLLVAHWGGTALRKMLLPGTLWSGPAVDMRIMAFTAITAFVVGLAAGLVPAFQVTRTGLHEALKSGARDGGIRRSLARSLLLGAQGALSVVLLVAAGLVVRSLNNVRTLPLGFDAQRMIYASVSGGADSLGPRISMALNEAAQRLAVVPGVRGTAVSTDAPMYSGRTGFARIPARDSLRVGGSANYVSASFFGVTAMPFAAGRAFTRDEAETQAPVLVVNQSFARRAWPGQDAVGKCVMVGMGVQPCSYVVGVTRDARRREIIEAQSSPEFFAPLSATVGFYRPNYVIINADPQHAAEIAVRAEAVLKQLLGGVVPVRVRRFSEQIAPQYRPWETGAKLFTALGVLALLVAAIGAYSVVAYSVSQRTHEMGVRVALGAQARDVLELVVSEGMRVIAIGIAAGMALALVLGRLIESQLFGVTTRDPFVMIGAASVLAGFALAACLVPAWRAARVDPMAALRSE